MLLLRVNATHEERTSTSPFRLQRRGKIAHGRTKTAKSTNDTIMTAVHKRNRKSPPVLFLIYIPRRRLREVPRVSRCSHDAASALFERREKMWLLYWFSVGHCLFVSNERSIRAMLAVRRHRGGGRKDCIISARLPMEPFQPLTGGSLIIFLFIFLLLTLPAAKVPRRVFCLASIFSPGGVENRPVGPLSAMLLSSPFFTFRARCSRAICEREK